MAQELSAVNGNAGTVSICAISFPVLVLGVSAIDGNDELFEKVELLDGFSSLDLVLEAGTIEVNRELFERVVLLDGFVSPFLDILSSSFRL